MKIRGGGGLDTVAYVGISYKDLLRHVNAYYWNSAEN